MSYQHGKPMQQQHQSEAERAAREATLRSLGISDRESRRYSLSRALLGIADGKLTGFEREIDQQVRRQHGVESSTNNSFFLPTGLGLAQKRDMNTQSNGAGNYLVGTDNLASSFIDLLRNRLAVAEMGATFLSGLVGNVTIPKLTASGTAHWLTNDSTAITESSQTIGQLAMSPKTVGAYTEVSRQLLMQSSPAIDSLVAGDLAKVLALEIDRAALRGDGSSGSPIGIANTGSIGSVTGTSMDYADVLEFFADTANVIPEKPGFVATPAVAALLMGRQKVSSTFSPIWQGNVTNGLIDGTRAMSSNQLAAGTMLFGAWEHLLLGEWGFLEIATNPFANFSAGIVGIRAMQSVDVAVRHAEAFSLATSIT